MSSPTKPNPKELFDHVVQVKGPINVNGSMCREGDTVRMTEAAAKSYGTQVKRASKPKAGAPAINKSQAPKGKA